MAELSELERMLAEPRRATADPSLLEMLGTGISETASAIGSGTTGAFLGFLDMLDRPRRALIHGASGDWRQAAEAFDPFNLITPDVESQPIGMADVMARAGVGEGFQTGIGSARAVGGFFLDVLTDPLTFLGATLGRALANKVLAPGGRLAQKGIGKLAAREIPLLSGAARMAETTGHALGDAFLKDYHVRRFLGTDADDYLKVREGGLRELGSKRSQYDALGAKIEKDIVEAESVQLQDLRALPGFTEEFMAAQGVPVERSRALTTNLGLLEGLKEKLALPATATGTEVRESLRRLATSLKPETAAKLKLALTGDPAFAHQQSLARGLRGAGGEFEDIRQTIPSAKLDLSDVPEGVDQASLGLRERMYMLDHFQPQKVEDLMKRAGSEYQGHYSSKTQVADEFLRLLKGEMPGLTDGMDPMAILRRAHQITQPAKIAANTLGVRKILGTLKEIEEEMGPLFERRLGPEVAQTGKRLAAVETTDGMFRTVLTDERYGRVLPAAADVPLPPGFVKVGIEKFPRSIQNRLRAQGTPQVAMHAAVVDDLFGKGGFLNRVEQFTEAGGVLGLIQKFNRYYKPWTLAHPATITRDAIGDLTMNAMSGVTPDWYGKAHPVQRAWLARQRGQPVPNPTQMVAGKPVQTWVEELTDAVIPGSALAHTEFYGAQFEALQGGSLRRIIRADPGQNTWTRATMQARGYVSDASRIAHYMQKRASGMGMEDAILSVKKNLYDVDQLTNFERGVMREVVPFYSFMRQNIPNMVKKTVQGTPFGKAGFGPNFPLIMGRTKINLDAQGRADVPEEILPEWLQGQVTLPVSRKNGVLSLFALNGWLPIADLTEVDSPAKFIRMAWNAAQPLITQPLELVFNWDAFFKRAIEQYDGQREHFLGMPLSRKSATMLRNVRLLNDLDRTLLPMIDKLTGTKFTTGTERMQDLLRQTEWTELAIRATTGAKIRPVDLQRAKQTAIRRTQREIQTLTTAQRYAKRDNDPANVRQTSRVIAQKRALLETLRDVDPERNPYLGAILEPGAF